MDWADWYVSLWMVKCMSHHVLICVWIAVPRNSFAFCFVSTNSFWFWETAATILCLKPLGYHSCFRIQQDVKYLVLKDLILSISTRQFYGRGCFTTGGTVRKTEFVFCFLLSLKYHLLLSICPLFFKPKAAQAVKSLLIYKVNIIMPQYNVSLENGYMQCLSSRHF